MAQFLGGAVTVASRPGEGSTFTLLLPENLPDRKPGEADPASGAADRSAIIESAPSGGRVLVIDDDREVLDLMDRMLTRQGFVVHAADNGPEGLVAAHWLRPIAILLDVKMPEMDGWAVLVRLKADPELAAIPVIMTTMIDDAQRGFTLGAAHYLLKPFDNQVLVETLRHYVGSQGGGLALVVDPDAQASAAVVEVLAAAGWSTRASVDLTSAREAMRRVRPDLVVVDLLLPGRDGIELVHEIQADPRLRSIPVIVIVETPIDADAIGLVGDRVTLVPRQPEAYREAVARLGRST
jgi:CheY-like chemotaxis protein